MRLICAPTRAFIVCGGLGHRKGSWRELSVAVRAAAAVAVHLTEVAGGRALVAWEAHDYTVALVALDGRGAHHLALLAVHGPVATLEDVTRSRVVDLLTHHVATRQRQWWLAAYLCAHTQ